MWRIYYGDGRTFSADDGGPQDAPALNVQAIAQDEQLTGWRLCYRRDFYWWDDGWCAGDLFGLFDYLARPGWKRVLFGRSIPDPAFEAILRRAHEELV